jgi:hypothetical protein
MASNRRKGILTVTTWFGRAAFARPVGLLAVLGAVVLSAAPRARAEVVQMSNVFGNIVSIRGNILEIRPSLRHVMARVAIDDKTSIVGEKQIERKALKPGVRALVYGDYNEKGGFKPFYMEVTDAPSGMMARKSHGLTIVKEYNIAYCVGDIKSVAPFVLSDGDGKDVPADIEHIRRITSMVSLGRGVLMIGSSIRASGPKAADGVVKAVEIATMDRGEFVKPGTMFGKVLAIHGGALTVLPRYSSETAEVTLAPGCIIQQQTSLDPDTVKVGDPVTFWARSEVNWRNDTATGRLLAVALLVGKERYPSVLVEGAQGTLLSGRLSSLDPVQVKLPSGKYATIYVPGQMPVARVSNKRIADLKPGAEAMFLLTPRKDGGFDAQAVILDASPWLGYGM